MWRLLFLFLVIGATARAAQPFTKDFVINESSAIPAKINAMASDDAGFIWLATDAGIFYFNGNQFTRISDSINKPATAIATFHNSIIAGFSNGSLLAIEDFSPHVIKVHHKQASSAITDIKVVASNYYYIATEDQGLFVIVNGFGINFNTTNSLTDNFINSISTLGNDALLLGTDNGINELHLIDKKLEMFVCVTANGLPDNIVKVLKPIPNTDNYILGTQEGGVAVYNKKQRTALVPELAKKWHYGQVNDIVPIAKNHIWISTEGGYLLDLNLDETSKSSLSEVYHSECKLGKLLLDKSGNLWASCGSVLKLFTTEYLSGIKLAKPYDLNKVTAIVCDKSNTLWFAQNADLYSVPIDGEPQMAQKIFTAKATISSLFVDAYDRLWIGTLGSGIWLKPQGKAAIRVGEEQAFKNESILNINGTANRLWLSGLNGVEEFAFPGKEQYQLQLIKHHNKSSGIGTDYVYQLFPDKENAIWMATDGAGICEYKNDTYKHWDLFLKNKGKVAYTGCQDAFGNIWVGTWYKNVYRLRKDKWENMMRFDEPGNTDLGISALLANNTGQVIAVFQRSILEWYPASKSFRRFNRKMNIGIDSTPNVVNCISRDSAGNVYVPIESGIAVFKNVAGNYDIRPTVKIVSTSENQISIAASKHEFPYDENDFTFHFNGVNLTHPDPLNYRYMLKGYKERWITTNDETVNFPRLPSGKYTFIVQSSNNNDFSFARSCTYTFVVEAPYWRKAWFIGLVIVIIILLANLYIRQRLKRLRNVSRLQEERMEFEYEHLKSQVNPHFLFNSLNTLTSLIEENKDNAVAYTIRLSDLYRNMLAFKDKDLVLLKEEWEILNNYIYIQQSRFGKALVVEHQIPDEVMMTKKIIPMALQLLVENAIKHNIVSASHPLLIHITANAQEIVVSNKLSPKISKEKSAGIGLQNISNRYKLLINRPIQFGIIGQQYVVKLPLL